MASKLDPTHRCYGKPSEIVVAHMPKGFGKHKIWGIWTTDGVDIVDACLVSDHDTYHITILSAITVAFKIQKMNQFNGWPIGLYYGSDGFANHTRYELLEEGDAVMHILANE